MPLILLLLFVVVPIAEIYVLVQVGQALGALPTIGLLLLAAVLGTWLLRREGRRAWQALQTALAERRVPTREVADGALVIVGGAFLLTPGFLTDAVGLACVLPPTRALLRRGLTSFLAARMLGPVGPVLGGLGKRVSRQARGTVVDGEVLHPEDPQNPEDPEGRND